MSLRLTIAFDMVHRRRQDKSFLQIIFEHVHARTHAHTHIYARINTQTHTQTHTHTHTHTHTETNTHIHTHTHTHAHTHTLLTSVLIFSLGDICLWHPSWTSVSVIRLRDIRL